MTETKPAIRQPDPEIARTPELDKFVRLGKILALAESGDERDPMVHAARGALRTYYAQEMGLGPTAALELNFRKGRLIVSSMVYRHLATRAGYEVRRLEEDATKCTAGLFRNGQECGRTTFTLEQAKNAGLVKNDSAWANYPERMLWARASGYVVRDFAPEVAFGVMLEDELDDSEGSAAVHPSPPPPPSPAPPPPAGPQPAAGETADSSASQPPPQGTSAAEEAEGSASQRSPQPEGEMETAEEAEWHEETEAERRRRLDARLAVICRDADPGLLPEGFGNWEGYSRWLAKERWGVVSRSELSNDQKQELIGLIQTEAVPF